MIYPHKSRVGCVRSLKLGMMLGTALMLSGCVVGPDYAKPQFLLPASWSGNPADKVTKPAELAHWWMQLGDPLLGSYVDQAIAGNLDVASAKAKIREARATTRQQFGSLLPSASGSGSVTRNRTAGDAAEVYNQHQAGFDTSWELDLFGANRRGLESAKYAEQAAEEELRDTMVTLVGDVASYYIEARQYQALIALAERSARSQRQTASLVRTQFNAGQATGLDTASADAQAASTEASVPAYRISYMESVHRLGVLLGMQPAALEQELRKPGRIPSPKLPLNKGIPADILVTRPDIRLAERQLAEYTAKIGQAEANRYPAISLTGTIATSATNLTDLGKKSTISWSFGPSLSLPIFQGGQLKAAVDVAKAQRDQYFLAYQYAVLAGLEDVENAIVGLTQTQLQRAKLAQSASSYRKAANLSRSLNEGGVADILDVLEAQRNLYTAEASLIESRAAIATYFVALNKALGGGWSGEVDVDRPAVVDPESGPRLISMKDPE